MVITGKIWSAALTVCGASIASAVAVAQQAATEAPTGFDTPTLAENPGSQSVSNGIAEPAGESFARRGQPVHRAACRPHPAIASSRFTPRSRSAGRYLSGTLLLPTGGNHVRSRPAKLVAARRFSRGVSRSPRLRSGEPRGLLRCNITGILTIIHDHIATPTTHIIRIGA